MTEQWRLVAGKELYDIQQDPAQENDVAKNHPELVRQFREALEKNRETDYTVIPRIQVGSEEQPHQEFTIYHWYDRSGFFSQKKITEGELVNGVIPIEVTESGRFEFTLRRWPPELNLPIRSKPSNRVAGYKLWGGNWAAQSKALDIRSARLRVDRFDQTKPVTDKMASAVFAVDLRAGETDIETWFHTGAGETLGAYYLGVRRLK